MNSPIKAILIGAGNRGITAYGNYALNYPRKLKFIAVAEPLKHRRIKFATLHNISNEMCFMSWEQLLDKEKVADVAFICTQDQMHVEPTIKALNLGYDVLLEKPIAHTLDGCIKIVKTAEENDQILGIGHVLRYTRFFSKIYDTINNNLLGNIINISHRENVSWFHMAHSFVRGSWRNVKSSSPMILAKCCHDFDLLYWMVGSLAKKVSSFGNLSHFTKKNAPKSSPEYCVEGCPIEKSCLYYAPRIYIDIVPILQIMEQSGKKGIKFLANLRRNHLKTLTFLVKIIKPLMRLRYWREWPVEPLYLNREEYLSEDYTDETKLRILKESQYGRCVYKCDNDVVDHQVVNLEFENGVTANLTMHGFSEREGRTLRIDGTKATLFGAFQDSGQKISIFDHYSGIEKEIFSQSFSSGEDGHGGGDFLMINAFLKSILERRNQPLTNARESLESHLIAFAANESRLRDQVIEMKEFRNKAENLK
jgi:predicted dehydrogenase